MRKAKSGFTIVELLIVIVVIGVLAAITVVAYNGVQARSRDNIRYSDAKAIIKALELYKVDKGTYPPTSAATSVAIPGGSTGCVASGYGFSWATDDSWMKPLVTEGYIQKTPVPPGNDCTQYYRYLKGGPTSYGCTRTSGWYMLQIVGTEGTITPTDSAGFTPCTGASAAWGINASTWTFAKDDV